MNSESMNDQLHRADVREVEAWVGWCCSYCAAPLEVRAHGLFCRAEGRFFATLEGVHRLLPEERRREVQPLVELQQRAKRDGADSHAVGRRRARMLRQASPWARSTSAGDPGTSWRWVRAARPRLPRVPSPGRRRGGRGPGDEGAGAALPVVDPAREPARLPRARRAACPVCPGGLEG